MKKQNGFTLIELVVVMVILGILAAVALPKFVDMSSQARVAKADAAYGAVRSAMALTHAASLAAGTASTAAGTTNKVTAEGTDIFMAYGYPTLASIADAAGLVSPDYTINATAGTITVPGAKTATKCVVTYTAATSTAAATVVKDASDC